jgi:hypothetical protein
MEPRYRSSAARARVAAMERVKCGQTMREADLLTFRLQAFLKKSNF